MLPTEKDWTVIFSNQAAAWGSFSYDQKEDALRITVTPQTADFQERLGYTFEEPTDTSVQAVLRWEKVSIAFPITADTPQLTVASLRRDLRGLARFSWQGWNQAAAYCLRANVNLDEALEWSNRSIAHRGDVHEPARQGGAAGEEGRHENRRGAAGEVPPDRRPRPR